MTEAAERAGMHAVRRAAMKGAAAAGIVIRVPMIGSGVMIEACVSATEGVVITEFPAVRDVRVIAVNHAVSVPIRTPAVPPPAEATVQTDANSEAEPDPRPIVVEARNSNPAWIIGEGIPVDDPGIVFRHINDLWICRLNDDRIPVGGDGFLLSALQVSCLLRSLTHLLNGIEDILLPVHIRLAEGGRPGQILVHHAKQSGILRQSLDARIPGLRVDRRGK